MKNGHNSIDSLILLNELSQYTQPSTTAVGTSVPSREDFSRNQTQNLANQVGSIQSNPAYDEEGNLKYKGGYPGQGSFIDPFDLIPGLGAVGASIRGGKVAKSTLNQLLGLLKKTGVKLPKGITASDLRGKGLENILDRNIYSKARIQNQKALDKYGIANPDQQGMVDPVSALLNYFSKN